MFATIREITEVVGGRLEFGPMPPLDGEYQPIRRIVPDCRQAHTGDVVLWCGEFSRSFDLPDGGPVDSGCFLEEAFSRGALGVIADRRITPWPGRFCLQVDDPREALSRIAERQQIQAIGKRALVVDPLVPSPSFHVLCQASQQQANELELADASDALESLKWQLIGLDTTQTHTLLHTTELPKADWQHVFLPDVVLFSSDWRELLPKKTLGYFVDAVRRRAAGASIVCPDFWHDEYKLFRDHEDVTTYGTSECATIQGRVTQGQLTAINRKPVALANRWIGIEYQALAAVAAIRVMEMNESTFIRSCLEERSHRQAS